MLDQKLKFYFLQITRIALAYLILFFLFNSFDLGTTELPFYSGATFGIILAGFLRNKSFSKTVVVNIILYLLVSGILSLSNYLLLSGSSTPAEHDFLVYRYIDAFNLFSLAYLISFLTTWLYWHFEETLSLETFSLAIFFLWLLSSHRNFQLDSPKKLSEIAWHYAIDPINALIGLAVVFTITVCFYLFFSHNRPLTKPQNIKFEKKRFSPLSIFTPMMMILLLLAYSSLILKIVAPGGAGSAQSSEGVGMKNEQGQSPLRFNSAVNKVKQPMAIVRLESDYESNPLKPMLYFREQALSEYNGHEMILSNLYLDKDVPQNKEPYFEREVETHPGRIEVKHSTYLLADHPVPFAIDFPTSIKAIKNPDADRFKTAYLADSFALQIPLDSLDGEDVGNPEWDDKTWQHYLRAPGSQTKNDPELGEEGFKNPILDKFGEDLRYRLFAKKISEGKITHVQKAKAIMAYLSKKSLYTLEPGHTVGERDDPVAPYLFSEDMRGYCVHFAHAITYMLRALEIPARIGTGYLTDLTYAKDGHILLQTSDRHAWAEMYIRNIGWVVVDITPENVEGEQDLIPDAKLLEELMTKLGPLEEIDSPDFETSFKDASSDENGFDLNFQVIWLYRILLLLVILFLSLKAWLRFSYLLPANVNTKLIRKTRSFSSLMCDLGLPREEAETRLEYALRLKKEKNVELQNLAKLYEVYAYAENKTLALEEVGASFKESIKSYKPKWKYLKRTLAFLNPASILRWNQC